MNLNNRARRTLILAAITIAVPIGTAAASDATPDPVSPSTSTPAPESTESIIGPTTTTAIATTTIAPTTTGPSTSTPTSAPSPTTSPPMTTVAPAPNNVVNIFAASAASAPQSPTATPGNASVKLTWLAPSSNGGATIDKYVVQRSTSAAGPWTNIAFPTSVAYTATGLTNGAHYYFRIAAHNTAGWSPYSTVVNAVPRTVATAPRSPVATPGNTTVKLTWLAPSSNGGATIDKYLIQRSSSSAGPWTSIATSTSLGYTAGGLSNGAHYYFRIAAHNPAGWGTPSSVVTAVPRTVPSAPRSPVATPGNTAVKLTWLASSSNGGATIDKYVVQRSASAAGPWTTITTTTALSYTAGALTNGVHYYFRIVAHNAAGWSPSSTIVTAVPRTVPTAPRSPVAIPGNGTITLTWLAPASTGGATIDTYAVQYSSTGVGGWQSVGWPKTLTYKEYFLTNGTKYYFRIVAHNAAGWGPPSTVTYGVPLTVPSVVPICNAVQGTQGSKYITVLWQAPYSDGGAPIEDYRIEIWTNGVFWYGEYRSGGQPINGTFHDAFYVGYGSYDVRVSARNLAGDGSYCLAHVAVFP